MTAISTGKRLTTHSYGCGGDADLVGSVGDADVEVGQLGLDEVTDHDLELSLLRPTSRLAHQPLHLECSKWTVR